MPTPYYPGIPLDEWTDIVKVSWGQDTILDFVHDKYMVKGVRQKRKDVLWGVNGVGHDVANTLVQTPPGPYPAEGVGLDLRGAVDSFGFPVSTLQKRGRLRNKIAKPTKKSPGALNEFTFLNYTMIIEFDWFDIGAAFYAKEGGFDAVNTGGWDVFEAPFASHYSRTTEGSPNGQFAIWQSLARQFFPSGSNTFVGEDDYDFWVVDPAYGVDAFVPTDDNTAHFVFDDVFYLYVGFGNGTHTLYVRHVRYRYQTPSGAGYLTPAGLPLLSFLGPTGSQPAVFQGGLSTYTYTAPPPGFTEFFTRPSLAAFDERLSDRPGLTPRVVPGTWDGVGGQWAPKWSNLEVPYARTRLAVNVAATHIAIAANGGDPFVRTQNSRIQIPRLTPIDPATGKRQGYFPPLGTTFPVTPGAEAQFQGYIRVRYVRLYRKRKPLKSLKKLSRVVRIPKWWAGTKDPT